MPWGPGRDHWGEKAAGSSVGMKAKAQVQSGSAGPPWAHTLPAPSGLDKHRSPQCLGAPVLTDMGGVWRRQGGGILIHWATSPKSHSLSRADRVPGPWAPS